MKHGCPLENDCECEWRSGAFCTIPSSLNREVCRSIAAEIGDRDKELKPCPACGGEARIYVRQGGASGEFFAGCRNMKCPTYTLYAKSEIEAATMWNDGELCTPTVTDKEIAKLEMMASKTLRLRIWEGLCAGEWCHYLDRTILETGVKHGSLPHHHVALVDSREDAAFIGAASPRIILGLIRELRKARIGEMPEDELSRLEELAEKAKKGPWKVRTFHTAEGYYGGINDADGRTLVNVDAFFCPECGEFVGETGIEDKADAEYIAAANPATILSLIRELRSCRELLRVYKQL